VRLIGLADDGRSISAETIAILKNALSDRLISKASIMRDIAERRARIRGPVDSVALIREDRDR